MEELKYQQLALNALYCEILPTVEMAPLGYRVETMPPSWQSYDSRVYGKQGVVFAKLQSKQTSDGRNFELSDLKFDFLIGLRFNHKQLAKRLHPEIWVVPVAICAEHITSDNKLALARIPDEYKLINPVELAYVCKTPKQYQQRLLSAKDPWLQIPQFLDALEERSSL